MSLVSKLPLAALLRWRTVAIILALINLKNLPFVWHFRLLRRLFANITNQKRVEQALKEHATTGSTHPIFQFVSIHSHSPFLETDYNLHKSNSTYFSDLDESRTALVTKILSPGMRKANHKLVEEGHKGKLNIILGSVHVSFHKEVLPYETYEIRSRILGWERKWLIVGSFFVRLASRGKEEVLLASALNKYVVKKGRFTVSPELIIAEAGWLPSKPDNISLGAGQSRESSDDSEEAITSRSQGQQGSELSAHPLSSTSHDHDDGLRAPIAEKIVQNPTDVVQKLEEAAQKASRTINLTSSPIQPLTKLNDTSSKAWDWHRVEMERLRGLRLAEEWLKIDGNMSAEFRHVV